MITQERLKELLEYDLMTGLFTWKVVTNNKVKIGDVAGTVTNYGYVRIKIDGKQVFSHILAWLYIHGTFPNGFIDHKNGIRSDNRLCNLRDVSRLENSHNKFRHRQGKLVGASFDKSRNKWAAYIRIKGKRKFLGRYESMELAHEAYLKALSE